MPWSLLFQSEPLKPTAEAKPEVPDTNAICPNITFEWSATCQLLPLSVES